MKTTVFIDGENFRKSIRFVFHNVGKPQPIWHEYDFKGLLDKVLEGMAPYSIVFYFAKLQVHPATEEKSKHLIEERRLLKTTLERSGYGVIAAGRVREHSEYVAVLTRSMLEKKVDQGTERAMKEYGEVFRKLAEYDRQ